MLQRLASSGVHLIGVSVDAEAARKRIQAFLDRLGVSYSIAAVEPEELDRLITARDEAIPISLVLDRGGALRAALQGWSRETEERLLEFLSDAN